MSQNPYNNQGMGPGGGNMNNGMNNPRMQGMMGPGGMNRMPQMGGGGMGGYQGRPMGPGMGPGPGQGMGNMGRMMGPGPGGMVTRGPGPTQYGGPGPGNRMMTPGMVPNTNMGGPNVRMPPVSSVMDTTPGHSGGGGQVTSVPSVTVSSSEPMVTSDTDTAAPNVTAVSAAAGNTPSPAPAVGGKVTPTPQKEVNISTVCRIGQETVEEIVSRTQEVFSILKSIQPPVGSYNIMSQKQDQDNNNKQKRLNDVLNGIGLLFKRLQVCWDKCQENTGGMDFYPIESLIPLQDESQDTGKTELEKKRGEPYKTALDEHNELVQQITIKNRHLKEIIDQMRNIIWEINTMLAMRTT